MPRYLSEPPYTHGTAAKCGVLLINLGTPDAPTAPAVRRYLREFLSDPRVVEIPRAIWWLILNLFILPFRPKQSARRYAQVWTPDGSPLRMHTEKQARMLRGYLGERIKAPLVVDYAMRYGTPSISSVVDKMKQQGCNRILAVPLYPQYAASTTATALDAIGAAFACMRNQPALRSVRNFHDHPGYIAALAQSISDYWVKNGRPDKLVMSFHGVPRFSLDQGDPYHCECQAAGSQPVHARVSVAVRPRAVVETLYRRGAAGTGQTENAACRRRVPGLRRRLPGNAGGNRDRGQGDISDGGRQGLSRDTVLE